MSQNNYNYQQPTNYRSSMSPSGNGNQISLKFNIISIALTTIALNIIWWVYPLVYSQKLEGQIPVTVGVFMISTFCLGAGISITFSGRFKRFYAIIPIVLGIVLSFNALIASGKIEIFLLLLLFGLSLIAIQTTRLQLNNGFGLTIYSFMASTSIPLAVFYLQNNYLTQKFLFNLIPLLFSFFFFMTPIFLPGKFEKRISLIFGVLYSLNILTLGYNIWTMIAIGLVAFTWIVLINMNLRQKYRLATFTILQMLSVLIIFMQQIN